MKNRASGILLHITSLPSKYGIGDLGPQAYKFADFLVRSKQSYWQVLPLNPTVSKNPYSPYNCLSAFAGNTLLISGELLYRQGLLTRNEIQDIPTSTQGRVDYRLAVSYRKKMLRTAYQRFKNTAKKKLDYEEFCSQNKNWLQDFAIFAALRQRFRPRLWCDWPAEYINNNDAILKSVDAGLHDLVEIEKFAQYIFFSQWSALKNYCNQRGIGIIGDIPIYVGYDSADVWAHPENFLLTKTKKPRVIAGAPPDFFSSKGQLWGNPVYDWQVLKNADYSWWIQRMKHNLSLFDIVRIDHFRGFFAYWQIPAGHKTATKGKWVKGPGQHFFEKLFKQFDRSRIIVEDLGHITSDITDFIKKFQLSCMRVLLFAFDGDFADNPHIPFNHTENCVVYTGTHDNNTIRGWFDRDAKPEQKKKLFDYLEHKVPADQLHWELIQLAMSSVGKLVIIPMQDILGLDEHARMNRPAAFRNNWRWRLQPGQVTPAVTKKLAKLTQVYDRT